MVHDIFALSTRLKLPAIIQSEAAECGLACLAMVAGFHGYKTDLLTLRQRFATSLKGMTLADMVGIADVLGMAARGLRLEPEEMGELKLPCVLHWDMNHFVVLAELGREGVVIHDPARGRREVSWAEVSKHFTGIALELAPTPAFRKAEEKQNIPLRMLLADMPGLGHAVWQIFLLALVLEVLAILSPMLTQWMVDGVLVSADRELLKVLVAGSLVLVLTQLPSQGDQNFVRQRLAANAKKPGFPGFFVNSCQISFWTGLPACSWRSTASWRAIRHRRFRSGARRSGDDGRSCLDSWSCLPE